MFSSLPKISVCAALCGLSFFLPALSAQNRLPQVIAANAQRTTIKGVTSPRAAAATDLGAAVSDTPLTNVTLRFNLTAAQETALEQLERGQQNPASPLYHQWLTPEQYAAAFGLSAPDLSAVTAWLQAQGLTVTSIARSHTFITVSGSAAAVSKAFQTSIHQVSFKDETHLTNMSDPALPAQIAGVVSGITGLNDFKLKPHVHERQVPDTRPAFTSSISGSTFLAPGDFYTIYDLNPLLTKSINGTGITIGVMGQTDISTADVAAFRSASGLSTTNLPVTKLYGNDPGVSANDLPEAQLDVEWSGAVAPNASILYVNSQDVLGVSMTQAIDNNVAPILTVSYGDCESGFGSANLASFNQLFRQANVQGQTVLGPGGDSGATDCDYDVATATQGLAVDFPASSPYVTGVGGTEFNEAGGTYFSTTNNANSGSAISYIPEMVWNDSLLGGGLAAGGGGASTYFAKPSFQIGTGVPNDYSRDVPDVAFSASADHDGYLFCSNGFCTNGYRNAANNLDVVGGTSVSTPAYAGILALLEQQIQTRIGNANPTIYGLANSTYYNTVFHDVTVGNNDSPCQAGTPNCGSGGSIGYNATAGYDLATGWGSVDVNQMVADWKLVSPAGVSSSIGTNISQVTLSSGGCPTISANTTNVTIAVNVASAQSGVSTIPTGTVQLLIDNVASGGPIAIVNGTATFTVPTAGLSSGSHTLGVAYSGDGTYTTSKGTISLDAVSASAADFLLSNSSCTLSLTSGSTSSPITFTVASLNGFAGRVTFTASTPSTLGAGYSFTVTPVTLTAGGTATTAFTLQAFYNPGTTANPLTVGNSTAARQPGGGRPWELIGSGTGTSLAGLLLLVLPRRRRSAAWSACAVLLLSAGLFSVAGCGSGTAANPSATNINTPAGTYSVIVTATGLNLATGTTITHNSTVTVVVH